MINNPLSTALIPLTVTLSLSLMLQKGKSQLGKQFIALKPILACLCLEAVFRDLMCLNLQEGPSMNPKSLKYFSSPSVMFVSAHHFSIFQLLLLISTVFTTAQGL